eukprot:TRINITY_DN5272_c0_g1_i1.p1 TRINITY_DN5272_c0_g1~~TRINITY_DN5272_c0_g1_i1.p1  ORF type:complete len:911 (-),score=157.93 TRINITY_DN5272_c0_g1_i1:56-2389(-)
MTPYMMFRSVLNFIVNNDWKSGIFMELDENVSVPENVPDLFKQQFKYVFLDPSGRTNLASRLTPDSVNDLVREASNSLSYMDDIKEDGFEDIFLKPVRFEEKYDFFITLKSLGIVKGKGNYPIDISYTEKCKRHIKSVLFSGLGDRIQLLKEYIPISSTWDLLSDFPKERESISIGFIFDQENFGRQMDKGPAADDEKGVSRFKWFWGDKTSIRRFRDGTILACCLWDDYTVDKNYLIARDISSHLLQRHCDIPYKDITYISNNLDEILFQPDLSRFSYNRSDDNTIISCVEIVKLYEQLEKKIKSLDDLPLRIHSLYNISQSYRYTDPYPPLPNPLLLDDHGASSKDFPLFVPSIEAIIQFESSGSWPDEISSITAVKTAFYLKLSSAIETQLNIPCHASRDKLDIFYEGYVFRIYIHHPREIHLMEKQISKPIWKTDIYRRNVGMNYLTQALHGLHLRHPSFGMTCKLALRWIHESEYSHHIEDIAIELMVAHIYVNSRPYDPPNHHISGFIRFLKLLAEWKWNIYPLIVDIDGDLNDDDYRDIQNNFKENKKYCECFIAHRFDKVHSMWTREKPSSSIFHLIQNHAKNIHNNLLNRYLNFEDVNTVARYSGRWKALFMTKLSNFDVRITMKPHLLPRYYQRLGSSDDSIEGGELNEFRKQHKIYRKVKTYKNLKRNVPSGLLIDFDPAERFLSELEERFSHLGVFFHNPLGGNIIHIIWNPSEFLMDDFKLRKSLCKMPIKGINNSIMFLPNVMQIINEIRIIGKDIIDRIDLS